MVSPWTSTPRSGALRRTCASEKGLSRAEGLRLGEPLLPFGRRWRGAPDEGAELTRLSAKRRRRGQPRPPAPSSPALLPKGRRERAGHVGPSPSRRHSPSKDGRLSTPYARLLRFAPALRVTRAVPEVVSRNELQRNDPTSQGVKLRLPLMRTRYRVPNSPCEFKLWLRSINWRVNPSQRILFAIIGRNRVISGDEFKFSLPHVIDASKSIVGSTITSIISPVASVARVPAGISQYIDDCSRVTCVKNVLASTSKWTISACKHLKSFVTSTTLSDFASFISFQNAASSRPNLANEGVRYSFTPLLLRFLRIQLKS